MAEEADAGVAERRERVPVRGFDVEGADADDEQHDHQLDATMAALKVALSLNSLDENDRQINVITIAGRSRYDPVVTKPVSAQPSPTLRQ